MSRSYDDIINLPHHVSATRRQMPLAARAAQFAPFAALTGHNEAIKRTAEKIMESYRLRDYPTDDDSNPTINDYDVL